MGSMDHRHNGNVWFVIQLLSVNTHINTYSVYDVWVAYITGRVTVCIWPTCSRSQTFAFVWLRRKHQIQSSRNLSYRTEHIIYSPPDSLLVYTVIYRFRQCMVCHPAVLCK